MCDYCECDVFGTIVWNNDVPTISSGDELDLSDCWIVRGNEVIAYPKRKDGGIVIKSRRANDNLSIAMIEDFEYLLSQVRNGNFIWFDKFVVADPIITSIMADSEHGDIHFYITLKVSLYLPDKDVDFFVKTIKKLHDVNRYGIQTSVSITTERTQESFNGAGAIFLGMGESPLEDKFYHSLPRHIQNIVDAQFPISRYRADFAIESKKLVIEIDGHDYHSSIEQVKKDKERDAFMVSQGWRVIRFTGKEVFKDMNRIVMSINSYLS